MEQEDERDFHSRTVRQDVELQVTHHILTLFLTEKLQSYQQHLKLSDAKLKDKLTSIIDSVFGP